MKELLPIVDAPSPADPTHALHATHASCSPEEAVSAAEFAAALERQRPALAALLRRVVVCADLRGDALQEAFARAWRHRASYDTTRPIEPWLATIALRVAKEQERGRRRRPEASGAKAASSGDATAHDTIAGDILAGDTAEPHEQLARREEAERLRGAVASLGELPRRIVGRFYGDGASVAVIAAELALPVNTVKSHLRRARIALAAQLGAGEES